MRAAPTGETRATRGDEPMSNLPRPTTATRDAPQKGHSGVPAVVYGVKSTEDPNGSIPTQLAQCRERAEAEGRLVVEAYDEAARSGYSGSRGPQLEAAKAHAARLAAEHGEAELWVQHSDRLARGDG